jgi:hypothetical protein
MAGKGLIFRLFKGDQFLREERLNVSVIKVGKLSSSHLRLDDESVSRMHAVIEVTPAGEVSIIDLGSTKGTFVNGQKVNKAKLQSGDLIVLGDTRIEVTFATEDEESPTKVALDALAQPFDAPAAPVAAPPAFAVPAPAAALPAPAAAPIRPPPGITSPPPFGAALAVSPGFQQMQAESIDDAGGARAVEVAAMLGDSVVSVRHLINPRGGKLTGLTIGLLAGGAVLLVMSAIVFVLSWRTASYNAGKRHHWVEVQKKPIHGFRPVVLSPAYDWASFGGLFVGLALVTSGLLRRRDERVSPYFRIGSAPEVEFPLEQAPSPSFAMIAPRGDDFVFNYGQGMDGEMLVDGKSISFTELQAMGRATPSTTAPGGLEVAIPHKARLRVKAGGATFMVASVNRPKRHPVPLALMATGLLIYVGATGLLLGGGVLLAGAIAPDQDHLALDLAALEDSALDTSSTSQDDPPPPEPEESEDDGEEESGGTGTAMALEEGKMGKKESDRAEGQYMMQKTQEQEQLARKQAIEAARTAGILGSTALQQGGAFASLTGTGDISSGFDDVNIYGGLLGNEAGEMAGGFGFGRSGFGPGGGGTGWGTIGTGRYGTIGHGSGTGSGYGVGGGRGGIRGRSSAVPQVKIGQPSAQGDLDKAIIRRYIKRNIQKITYCYEKELLAKPGLAGTVTTTFLIMPNGTVASSDGSGVDGSVSGCVAGVIKGIEFPKPKGGGSVKVNYPFIFRPTGG